MPSKSSRTHDFVNAGLCALFALAPVGANAAFFQLAENSPAALGNANAGGAASASDASTVWYNPAGLTRLPGAQLVAGGHFIKPSLEFSKTSATLALGGPISGGNGGDAGESAFVPNFYYSQQLNNGLTFGLGVNAPFGLATDYDDDWVGRYHANRSEIKAVNINPALGYKVNDQISLGAGINYQKLDAELTQAVDFGSICALGALAGGPFGPCAAPGAADGQARVEADDDAWGYNFGLLGQIGSATRLGFAYRSKMKYALAGSAATTAPSALAAAAGTAVAGITANAGVGVNVTLPATLSLSAYQTVAPNWGFMADITRTFWSKLPELRIDFDNTQPDSVVTLELKDVNRYSIGLEYKGAAWTYRAGLALDRTPTPNAEARTPRLPDEDRTWLSFGAGYKASDTLSVDFAYTYVAVDDAHINKSAGASPTGENFLRGNLVGDYDASTNIVSVQGNWKF